jgi:hypothetical protein
VDCALRGNARTRRLRAGPHWCCSFGRADRARAATVGDLYQAIAWPTGTEVADSVHIMVALPLQAPPPNGGWWRVIVDAIDEAATATDRDELARALAALAALPRTRIVVASGSLSRRQSG